MGTLTTVLDEVDCSCDDGEKCTALAAEGMSWAKVSAAEMRCTAPEAQLSSGSSQAGIGCTALAAGSMRAVPLVRMPKAKPQRPKPTRAKARPSCPPLLTRADLPFDPAEAQHSETVRDRYASWVSANTTKPLEDIAEKRQWAIQALQVCCLPQCHGCKKDIILKWRDNGEHDPLFMNYMWHAECYVVHRSAVLERGRMLRREKHRELAQQLNARRRSRYAIRRKAEAGPI